MIPIVSDGIAVYAYRRTNDDFEFLQLRRADGDIYAQTWQPIYGGVLADEKAVDAARRELLEEAGVISNQMFLVEHVETFFFRPNNAIHMLPVFAAEISAQQEILMNEEHDAYRWVKSSEVRDKFMWRSQREAMAVLIETLTLHSQHIPALVI